MGLTAQALEFTVHGISVNIDPKGTLYCRQKTRTPRIYQPGKTRRPILDTVVGTILPPALHSGSNHVKLQLVRMGFHGAFGPRYLGGDSRLETLFRPDKKWAFRGVCQKTLALRSPVVTHETVPFPMHAQSGISSMRVSHWTLHPKR